MDLNLFTILDWISAVILFSLCLVIYLGSNKLSSRCFALCIFFVSLWSIVVGLQTSVVSESASLFFIRSSHFLGTVIPVAFLYFFLTYPEDIRPNKRIPIFLIVFELIYAVIFFGTPLIIESVYRTDDLVYFVWNFGDLIFLFDVVFFGFFAAGVGILLYKYKSISDFATKNNIKYMIYTVVIGALPPSFMCVILPRLGNFDTTWLGPVTQVIWIPIIAYSIIKYRQMNVRIVVTEVLAVAMTIIFFGNIFLDFPLGIWARSGTFIIFLIIAYYLIRLSLKESEQKEQLSTLNNTLEQKVAEQTVEIRKSYDLEKKARRELEKLNETKDQFIMITQHHLRTPVSTIRWSVEALLKNAYGELLPAVRSALEGTNKAVSRLTRIVDDFLSITGLKVGMQILNIEPANVKPLLEDVLDELRIDIENKKIKVTFPTDDTLWPQIDIDASKIREVILIVIENAVKYNVDNGTIDITPSTKDNAFILSVKNTGIGIESKDHTKIFTSLFHRSETARKAHPIGMGIGLSVSRAIVRAHHGEISIHSDGQGMGARVEVKLPLKRIVYE